MKNYSPQECILAEKTAPKPVVEFVFSPTLRKIYEGMEEKHTLTVVQGGTLADLVKLTLIGLEPQSAFATNLHQEFPELSNDATRELIADVSDRIFKEAQRRLRENVSEPSPASEVLFAPDPTPEEKAQEIEFEHLKDLDDDAPELEKLRTEEAKEEEERRLKEDEEEKKLQEEYPKLHAEALAKAGLTETKDGEIVSIESGVKLSPLQLNGPGGEDRTSDRASTNGGRISALQKPLKPADEKVNIREDEETRKAVEKVLVPPVAETPRPTRDIREIQGQQSVQRSADSVQGGVVSQPVFKAPLPSATVDGVVSTKPVEPAPPVPLRPKDGTDPYRELAE